MSQVRVGKKTHELLRMLSSEENKSMHEIIEAAVEDYRRKLFLQGLNRDFQNLNSEADSQDSYDREMAEWDATAGDGLENL